MIHEFIDSWELFRYSYLEGWLLGVLLALVGVVVIARDQIFLGAAVSQASTLGIALALWISGCVPWHDHALEDAGGVAWLSSESFQATMAVLFSVVAALAASRSGWFTRDSHEAITGWVFLISASLSVLVVSHSPHGLDEISRIHSSSIIGATGTDVTVFAGLLAATVIALLVMHRRLLLLVMDPSMAAAVGIKVARWELAVSLWLGLVVGLSIRVSGMLFTFGSLVLPPLIAKNLSREVRPMFVIAPLVSLIVATAAFILANHYDFPPAQMNTALSGVLLWVVWLVRRLWR